MVQSSGAAAGQPVHAVPLLGPWKQSTAHVAHEAAFVLLVGSWGPQSLAQAAPRHPGLYNAAPEKAFPILHCYVRHMLSAALEFDELHGVRCMSPGAAGMDAPATALALDQRCIVLHVYDRTLFSNSAYMCLCMAKVASWYLAGSWNSRCSYVGHPVLFGGQVLSFNRI